MFNAVESPFSHLNTEYKRLQYFMDNGHFILPNEFEFGKQLKQIKTDSEIKCKWVKVTGQHIPLAPVLKKFLELPDSLSSILSYVDSLNQNTSNICNFIQTIAWKQKISKFRPTDIVFPLYVFFTILNLTILLDVTALKLKEYMSLSHAYLQRYHPVWKIYFCLYSLMLKIVKTSKSK